MISAMYKRRRITGTYAGAALAAGLLPGVSPVADTPSWDFLLSGSVLLIVGQLIHCYPSAIRTSPWILFGAIGIVQDTLVWLLVSWISARLDYGMHVDSFVTALAAGAIVRCLALALMTVGPQPAPDPQAG
ncbi:putative membrane protein [Streptomyces canus]|uniref:Membrane protein n=2 Tax=Streptomyces canus TaxID=58343 RepID=A0AAW8FDX4_9ACTN|nr:putative membrane protein [Streptomyces canus]MDQ0908342.1 putative membrane protein [Streptomyces canus]